jgi:hypothetical protein
MYEMNVLQDIVIGVQHALARQLDRLDEASLMQQSDAFLATLPGARGAHLTTTAELLRRYDAPLHEILCWNQQPRSASATVGDELRDLARAIVLTLGPTEGISVDSAVSLALVLHKRGVGSFCTQPKLAVSMT